MVETVVTTIWLCIENARDSQGPTTSLIRPELLSVLNMFDYPRTVLRPSNNSQILQAWFAGLATEDRRCESDLLGWLRLRSRWWDSHLRRSPSVPRTPQISVHRRGGIPRRPRRSERRPGTWAIPGRTT